jgi:hypothetical protein
MMRKISCKLWAHNKNNSNSNMMILYKIILLKKDLWQPAWLPSPGGDTPSEKPVTLSHLQVITIHKGVKCPVVTVMNNGTHFYYSGNKGPWSRNTTGGLHKRGVIHKTLEVLDSPVEWRQHLETIIRISCCCFATDLQWVCNLCILQVICIIKTLKDSTSHGN